MINRVYILLYGAVYILYFETAFTKGECMKLSEKNDYYKQIIDSFNQKLDDITSIKYHYNLFEVFKNLDKQSTETQQNIFEKLINNYLTEIKKTNIKDILVLEEENINNTLEFFSYEYFCKNQSNIQCYDLENEADDVANDLINKVIGINDRTIQLPLKINDIIQFNINGNINKKDINKVLMWVIMKLSVVEYFSKKKLQDK